jgi:type I restriction enzyme S subunit
MWDPGTLCITIAANIAETAILGIKACFPDSIVGFVADPDKADVRFVKYYIDFIKLSMQNVSRGTTQDNLSLDKLLRFDFMTPPLPIQKKIVAILLAYDDLIENNERRIRILEEMARNLYREWFVKFRFPGHKKVKMVDSPLGKIPEGWEARRFCELAVFENGDRGKNYPKARDFVDAGVPFINAGHLVGGTVNLKEVNHITEAVFARLSRGKIMPDDILYCIRGSLGRIARVGALKQGAIASSLVIIRPAELSNHSYLFYLLSGEWGRQMVAELDNGVAQPNISVESLKRRLVLRPTIEVLDSFAALIKSFWSELHQIEAQSDNLRQTRDLLLPKLISGQLDVSELDIEAPSGDQTPEPSPQAIGSPTPLQPAQKVAKKAAKKTPKKPTPRKNEAKTPKRPVPVQEGVSGNVMALFRQETRGRGVMDRDELIRAVAGRLGYRRVSARVDKMLRGNLRAAIRRHIIGSDGQYVWLETATMADYTRDELVLTFVSVMPKGRPCSTFSRNRRWT